LALLVVCVEVLEVEMKLEVLLVLFNFEQVEKEVAESDLIEFVGVACSALCVFLISFPALLVFTITCEECLRTLVLQDLQFVDSKFNKFLGKLALLLGRMQDFKFLVRKADINQNNINCTN
jgi:hypothetical protein